MAARRPPRVFSVPVGTPFLPTLVDALFDGRLVEGWRYDGDPLSLADVTVFVPTRRAARALREAVLSRLAGRAAILPKVLPLGELDEEDVLAADLLAGVDGEVPEIPPAVAPIERLLVLTRLVVAWKRDLAAAPALDPEGGPMVLPATAADAVHLARDLAGLIDQVATEEADWTALDKLVDGEYARYWDLTLRFLGIVTASWPAILAERGVLDPAERRRLLLDRQRERLVASPPAGPVIAAGSTGSIEATARLLGAIAGLDRGALVLPGLDLGLDEAAWTAIGATGDDEHPPVESHPQFGLKRLLARVDVTREEVIALGARPPVVARRDRLVQEALRPAPATDAWSAIARAAAAASAETDAALAGVSLLVARHEREEALAVAIALRETLETPGATAALVTPDRTLARRVAAELERFGVTVDDSAGRPLDGTEHGVFARLVADAACRRADPVTMRALLHHPLAAFGLDRPAARRAARGLDLAVFHGARPAAGLAGLAAALEARRDAIRAGARLPRPVARLDAATLDAAADLLARVTAALGPLEAMVEGGDVDLPDLLATYLAALRAAARDETGSDTAVFSGEAGEALALHLAGLVEAARAPGAAPPVSGAELPGFLTATMTGATVRRRGGAVPRLAILGPLEARLQSVDRLVLGGLVEGVWPATTRADPWLNRSMRAGLDLDPPERRIGLAAHDFAEGLGAREVVLTRPERAGGTPTVPSRWVQRLTALVGKAATGDMIARGERFVRLARLVDRPEAPPRPLSRPIPRPPVAARPKKLSVTEIETLVRDPYAIYARHVLGLDPLEPIGGEPDARDRGTVVHEALATFVAEHPGRIGPASLTALIAAGRAAFARLAAHPRLVALWWPRFEAVARFVVETEAARDVLARHPEVSGRLEFEVAGLGFRLTARADRIDRMADGRLAVIDFKTGAPPSNRQVHAGLAPQLPLTGAMVARGGFGEPLKGEVGGLEYWRLSASAPKVHTFGADPKEASAADLAETAFTKLVEAVRHYADPANGYPSRPRPAKARVTGDYDHLARVAEWATGTEEAEE